MTAVAMTGELFGRGLTVVFLRREESKKTSTVCKFVNGGKNNGIR